MDIRLESENVRDHVRKYLKQDRVPLEQDIDTIANILIQKYTDTVFAIFRSDQQFTYNRGEWKGPVLQQCFAPLVEWIHEELNNNLLLDLIAEDAHDYDYARGLYKRIETSLFAKYWEMFPFREQIDRNVKRCTKSAVMRILREEGGKIRYWPQDMPVPAHQPLKLDVPGIANSLNIDYSSIPEKLKNVQEKIRAQDYLPHGAERARVRFPSLMSSDQWCQKVREVIMSAKSPLTDREIRAVFNYYYSFLERHGGFGSTPKPEEEENDSAKLHVLPPDLKAEPEKEPESVLGNIKTKGVRDLARILVDKITPNPLCLYHVLIDILENGELNVTAVTQKAEVPQHLVYRTNEKFNKVFKRVCLIRNFDHDDRKLFLDAIINYLREKLRK